MIGLAQVSAAHKGIRERDRGYLLNEARDVCVASLQRDPRQPFLFNLLGRLAAGDGQTAFARACLSRAVALSPDDVTFLIDLAELLDASGDAAGAVVLYRQVLARGRVGVVTLVAFSRLLLEWGQPAEALTACEAALREHPAHAPLHRASGDIRIAVGQPDEALACYARALAIDPGDGETWTRVARAHATRGAWEEAARACSDGFGAAKREWADLFALHADVLLRLGKVQDAIAALREAIRHRPRHVDALHQLAALLQVLGRRDESASAWFALGEALESGRRFGDADAAYRLAARLAPDRLKAHLALGYRALQDGRPEDALPHFDRVLTRCRDHVQAILARGRAAALTGDTATYWRSMRWFEREGPCRRRYLARSFFDGRVVAGERVLVRVSRTPHIVLLLRFATLLAKRGARVIIECEADLLPFARGTAGVTDAVARGTPLPSVDRYILLTSLPFVLGVGQDTLSADVPYMTARAPLADGWRTRLGGCGKLLVGLRWASDTGRRKSPNESSMSLLDFAPLAAIRGIRFVCLQDGPALDELVIPPPGLDLRLLPRAARSSAHIAEVLSALDLVVTVDSSVAHLAGALARPVWTLLPLARAWCWHGRGVEDNEPGVSGQRSSWYPSMRLFGQTGRGDWRRVIEEVRAGLTRLAEGVELDLKDTTFAEREHVLGKQD